MNFDEWTKLLTLITVILQVIVWPILVFAILVYLRTPIKSFVMNLVEFTLKAGPFETTAKRQQAIEVATSVGAAAATERKENNTPTHTEEVTTLVDQLLTPETVKKLRGKLVLWVDDVPSNNTYQRNALEALGMRFTIAISTEDALKQLQNQSFDLIISDMGRPPDLQAGYTLLEAVKKLKIKAPYIVYAGGGNKSENKAEAIKRGAFTSVSGPTALFRAVIEAVGEK